VAETWHYRWRPTLRELVTFLEGHMGLIAIIDYDGMQKVHKTPMHWRHGQRMLGALLQPLKQRVSLIGQPGVKAHWVQQLFSRRQQAEAYIASGITKERQHHALLFFMIYLAHNDKGAFYVRTHIHQSLWLVYSQ